MAPRAPHTRDHPFAWEDLASEGSRPMNVAHNTSILFEGSRLNHFRILESVYSVTRGNGSHGNAFFYVFLLWSHVESPSSPTFAASFLFGSASQKRET